MKKQRMTIGELKKLKPSLSNPIKLVCDTGYLTADMREITVIGFFQGRLNILDSKGEAMTTFAKALRHYPSQKPEPEPLTFERIKEECEPMKHLLVDECGDKRLYLGFNRRGFLVLDTSDDGHGCICWKELEIKNWTIE